MNSKRKKKIAAATMAFTSIFGAKNSSAVPKSGNTAISGNSGEQNLPQFENTKKNNKKSQDTSNVPLVAGTLTLLAGIGLITYAARSNNKKTDVDNDNTDDNKSNKHNNPSDNLKKKDIKVGTGLFAYSVWPKNKETDIDNTDGNTDDNKSKKNNNPSDNLKKKDVKKVWENDPERIIKFITWYGGAEYKFGSCIANSYFNMFLNPVIVDYLENEKNANEKLQNQYWGLKIPILENIWEASKKHEFIKYNKQENGEVYFSGELLFNSLTSDAPDLIGTLGIRGTITKAIQNNEENNRCPPLVYCDLTEKDDNLNFESVLKDPDSSKASYKLPNGKSYFVGGAILRSNGHTVFAHLLYSDDGTKLERVIIQNPNSSSNDDLDYYVEEMEVDNMKQLFVVKEVGRQLERCKYGNYYIEKLLMIRDDKFMESKYWKNSSLVGDIVNKF